MATVHTDTRTLEISFQALNEVSERLRFLAEALQGKKTLDEFQILGLAVILRDIGEYVGSDLRSEHEFRYRNREAQ